METRIYGQTTDINMDSAKEFWESRGEGEIDLKTVLLGVDKPNDAQIRRNQKEKNLLDNMIKNLDELRILDIGSGIGRWADNYHNQVKYYDGIDYSTSFVNYANDKYRENKNINFYNMSVTNLDLSKLRGNYNLVIQTGVLVYINDSELEKIFSIIHKLNPKYFYMQETVSLMDVRLTLKDFDSKELQTNYNAIYRTQDEYEKYLGNFEIITTDLLLEDEIGGRKETNARYWLLKPRG